MAAVGFRVKSGHAIAVVLAGSRAAPLPVATRIVELSDPDVPETRQPYHDGFYRTEEDAREIARRVGIVKRCARKSIAALINDIERERRSQNLWRPASAGPQVRLKADTTSVLKPRAALVVGSLIDPSTVGNPHIRAHAHEGQLFRTVLEDALRAHDIECDVIVDKQLAARAAKDLGRPASAVSRAVMAFGKTLGGRWRAEEKAAATAAWLALRR
jgi:hypothetical protein